jgi:hypothetical protein
MNRDLAALHRVLAGSSAKVKAKVLGPQPAPLSTGDFQKLEAEILGNAAKTDDIPELLGLVRRIAVEAGTSPKVLNQQRVAIRYPLPKNPFADGLSEAEQIYYGAADWLAASEDCSRRPELSLCRFLVSAVLEFRVLHADYVPAILRSICERRYFRIHPTIRAVPLSLKYGRQENAERRLLILRHESLRLFERFLDTHGAVAYISELPIDRRPEALLDAIQRRAATPGSGGGHLARTPILKELIKNACTMAMFKLPSAIVAHRSREIVSHSLPPEVLGRISGQKLEPFASTFFGARDTARVIDDPDSWVPDPMDGDPAWMNKLREALNERGLDHGLLDELAKGPEVNPMFLAKFAKYLEGPDGSGDLRGKGKGCQPETIRRYCLLIASKLIPRLNTPVPEMTADAWEDAVEQVLDEDAFFNLQRYTASPNSKAQTHSRPLVKAVRHWLRFLAEYPSADSVRNERLRELEKRLPVLGLVAVDASLITVDEYKCALERLVGRKRGGDENEREATRVALILGYRCGLRRMESAGLRVCDFDSIDYLHVTANEMRPLKTSSAPGDRQGVAGESPVQ